MFRLKFAGGDWPDFLFYYGNLAIFNEHVGEALGKDQLNCLKLEPVGLWSACRKPLSDVGRWLSSVRRWLGKLTVWS